MTSWTVSCQAPWFMEFSRQEYRSGLACPPPGDLPNPGMEPRSPALQADSLLSAPPGKPKNIGVGSLSLLQGISLTQESNQGLPRCRWILDQLTYQGYPLKNHSRDWTLLLTTRCCLVQGLRWGLSVSLWSLQAAWLNKIYDKAEVPWSSLANFQTVIIRCFLFIFFLIFSSIYFLLWSYYYKSKA